MADSLGCREAAWVNSTKGDFVISLGRLGGLLVLPILQTRGAFRSFVPKEAFVVRQSKLALLPLAIAMHFATPAKADEVKQLTVEKGKGTIIANLVSARPDCSNNPGPQPLPVLSEKPLHGMVGVQLGVSDVPAAGDCPARKIPSFGLFYAPPPDYVGSDSFQLEINEGNNKQAKVSYQITVRAPDK
jgi:hypothetical protein